MNAVRTRPVVARRLGMTLATGVAGLSLAAAAQAAITVNVQGPGGAPLAGQSVSLKGADGSYAASGTTDTAGNVVLTLSSRPPVGPYTASSYVSAPYGCGNLASQEPAVAGIADGGSATLVSTLPMLCSGSAPSGQPDATGIFDVGSQSVLALPGGTADLYVRVPSPATGVTVSAGGTPLGGPVDSSTVRVTAPPAGYTGPLTVSYTYKGVAASYTAGTMTSRPVVPTPAIPGPIDIEAIVDVSGSMGGNDPKYVRKDAISLLVDLMRPGDKLGVTGFDDGTKPIVPLTTITGTKANANTIKGAARRGIGNFGGTDYDVGLTDGYTALTQTPGVDPARQKAVVFLTDGAHSGDYLNSHLRLALNPSGRSWPVCAVQLGDPKGFSAEDVARLKRIADETGGKYFAAPTAGRLTDIYAACFNLVAAQRTVFAKTFTFRPRTTKQVVKKVPKRLKQATFMANWGNGVYQVTLVDPKGTRHTAKKPGKGASFRRGATFAFYRINRPVAGRWRVVVQNVRMTGPKDTGKVTITTPK